MNKAMAQEDFHAVARAADIAAGAVQHVELAGRELALFNIDGSFFATDDRCTHMRARLSDGYVHDGVVECPLHFGKFDIRSGRALSPPCKLPLTVYAVRVEDGTVLIGVPAAPVCA
ncbi:MAG: non-heme iron oxygenase ferredoxin subunit [Burkholderiaceae bacterium]